MREANALPVLVTRHELILQIERLCLHGPEQVTVARSAVPDRFDLCQKQSVGSMF
jgi:hypothetical protein